MRAQLLLLALFIALPLLVGSAVHIYTRSHEGRTQAERDMQRTTRLIAERVEERVRSSESLLIGLSSAIRVDSLQSQFNDRLFASTLKNVSARYGNFFAWDSHGALIGTALHAPSIDTIRGTSREYFRRLMQQGGFIISEPRRSAFLNDSARIVVLARTVTDSENKITAVIGTSLRIDSLADLIKVDIPLAANSVVSIVDSSGSTIAASKDAEHMLGTDSLANIAVARKSILDGSTPVLRGADKVDRIFGFAQSQTAPWIVSVGIPENAALATVYVELKRDLLAGSVALVIAVLIALFLGGIIARPLVALSADARAIADGEEGRRSEVKSRSEIGLLATTFNQMADTVEKRNAAIAESERRYRLLFDSNPLPMFAWDAETLHIVAANEAAQDRYGYNQDQFLQLNITDLVDPSEHQRFNESRVAFDERRLQPTSWIHRTASGEKLDMEMMSTQSHRLGRASWLTVSIDVTARHAAERALARSEEQLRQSQKMEAIGAFAGGIAHDFNNLLTGMLGYCELAAESLPVGRDAWNDIQEIKTLAVRGAELTRQILTVSRKQVVQHTVFDVNAVVQSVDRLLRRLIGEHITLRTALVPEVGSIRADADQLEQVLLNLAANARDSMQPGGTLTITTTIVPVRTAIELGMSPRDWVNISVTDTGAGMSDEVKQRIFEPFYTTKERGKGTGLGLALVYGMVEQSGGTIRVTSAPGNGATFDLFFPRVRAVIVNEVVPAAVAPSTQGTEVVLLAEDEDSVRAVAKETLERRGYHVLAAPDGPSALALARAYNGTIDLLLTDVVMPGMNGRELAELLLAERPGTRVLFASGYTDDAVLLHGVRTDELSFIQKPFTPTVLMQRVRKVLDVPVRTS
ncbi:MAG: ATP-binding protein [Gemmatimonadota bacterium]|nr:ATP-binding protein [Gemmatimonadota bacterium]